MKQFSIWALAVASVLAFAPAFAQQDDNSGPNMAEDPVDTLARSQAKGKLVACADPYDWPYSSQQESPPGFDIDIMRSIAKRGNMRLEMVWADTGTRGGINRAFRNSILAKKCDVFLGLSDNGEDDQLPGRMVFTDAYIGLGYVLVVQGKASSLKTLDELKANKIKVGVSMATPMDDYLFHHDISRELYLGNRRIMEGMAKGDIDASMVWATAIAEAKQEFPDAKFHMVDGYVPIPEHRFNSRFAVRKEDKALLDFVNQSIDQLLSNGKVKAIVESYGVPFYGPVS